MRRPTLVVLAVGAIAPAAMTQNITSSNITSSANSTASASNTTTSNWNPSASSNPGTNPLIPTTLSTNCQAFLARLNSNSQVASCIGPFLNATSAFISGQTSSSPSDVESALEGLCGTGSEVGCGTELFKDVLTHFAGNCSAELTEPVAAVQASYDVLYILNPFRQAICSKDNPTGSYCYASIAASVSKSASGSDASATSASTVGNTTTGASAASSSVLTAGEFASMVTTTASSLVVQLGSSLTRRSYPFSLFPRQSSSGNTTSISLPNSTTFNSTNLPFLFLSSSLPSSALCTSCTQQVLAAFVAWEQNVPSATGISESGLLGGQLELWSGIGTNCGSGFLSVIQSMAGSQVASTSGARAAIARVGVAVGMAAVGVVVMSL